MKLVKEEAKVLRTIAANLAKEVIEAQERGAASGRSGFQSRSSVVVARPGKSDGTVGRYWYNPMGREIKLL